MPKHIKSHQTKGGNKGGGTRPSSGKGSKGGGTRTK